MKASLNIQSTILKPSLVYYFEDQCSELGKILEVLVLEYDFGRTRTRTRTRGVSTRTRTRGVGTRTRTRTRGVGTRTRTRRFRSFEDDCN